MDKSDEKDGTIDEVSILTVFEQAHLYTDLAGELATQNVAVLRLLLAVLHTVFSRVDEHREDAPIEETDDALERWGALWNANCFPIEPIKAYLHTQHEKFLGCFIRNVRLGRLCLLPRERNIPRPS